MPIRHLPLAALACATVAAFPGAAAGQTPELPRGGTRIFPDQRVVAFAGTPGAPALGALGIGSLESAVARLRRQARAYSGRGRRVLPALDLITVIAAADPGADGKYRNRVTDEVVERHLAIARENRALLLLNIQPGRSDFMTEVKHYEKFLREPEVGISLDPEWSMGSSGVPGRTIGSADYREIDRVSALLERTVRRFDLPPKLLVVHQFTEKMIRRREKLRQRPNVTLTVCIDGVGAADLKRGTYRRLARKDHLFDGFKLFYEEDGTVMTPRDVLRLEPEPDFVIYE